MVFQRVCLIGCGLIGGSLSLAIKQTGNVKKVVGVDVHPRVIKAAIERNVIDEGTHDLQEGITGADLVIIAAPVPASLQLLEQVAKYEDRLAPDAIVTDVCGVKQGVIDSAERIFHKAHFIGGHPMAGSEKTGVWAASATLFQNAVYVLTPTQKVHEKSIAALSTLLLSIGAKVRFMTPVLHDRVVAAISHVPHIIAALMVDQVHELSGHDSAYIELAAGGFRDITRIASSDPTLWRDISFENKKEIDPLLSTWIKKLQAYQQAIEAEDQQEIETVFTRAKLFRDALPAKTTGAIRPAFTMTVSVPDEPGLIGEVATLLGHKGISIRNIGILESREDDEGQLLLQFDTIELYERAAKELVENGYLIIDRLMS